MKKESEDLEIFNLYKMILNKIINEYTNNNKIDEFEAILYGALATGQDPYKVPILFSIDTNSRLMFLICKIPPS
jgi:hypothetical protein